MALTVAQLSAMPHLGLRVLGGASGAHRTVSWAHTSELIDPTPWLDGGELLMTLGINLPPGDAERRAYVERLAAAHVAGLAFDTGTIHDTVPAAIVRAGNDYGLPVLSVAARTPFLAISRAVISAITADQVRQVELISRHQGNLASAALLHGTGGVVSVLSQAVSAAVLLLDGDGHLLEAAGTDVTQLRERVLDRLGSAGRAGRRSHFTHVDDHGHILVQSLASTAHSRGYLALGSARALNVHERLIVSHALTLLAIVLDKPGHIREAETRLRRGVFRALLAQGADLDLSLLRYFGFPLDEPVAVFVLPECGPVQTAEELTADTLLEENVPFLLTSTRSGLAVLVPAERRHDRARHVQAVITAMVTRPVSVGVGKPVHPVAARDSFRQASSAARVAVTDPGRVIDFAGLGVFELLLGNQSRDSLEAIVTAVLGPIEDSRGGPELLRTTSEFLLRNGSWESAAASLGVHRHTLRNRIDRVATLLGRDLETAHNRAEVWMALMAREMLRMSGGDQLAEEFDDPKARG